MTGRSGLIGRVSELAMLDCALADLAAGISRTLVVSGEPGIGKSRLLDELAGRATDTQLVLTGRGGELERDLPFGVLVDALDDYLAAVDAPARFPATELAAVFPSCGPAATDAAASPEMRLRIQRAVRGLLGELAVEHPLVLVLDDLHWADPSTVAVLGYLVRHPPPGPVLLALGFRPAPLPPSLHSVLRAATNPGRLDWLEPGPLSRSEAGDLLAGARPGMVDQLHRWSGGNPFFLEQMHRRGPGPVSAFEAEPEGIPPTVLAAMAEELRQVGPGAREALGTASALGDPFPLDLAGDVAGLSDAEFLSAIDELRRADLVRAADAPRWLRFRHPLVRHVVYSLTGDGERTRRHRRADEVLAKQDATPLARAPHVERSASPGDAAAIGLLTEAGRAAAVVSPATAARWYAAALRFVPRTEQAVETRLGLLGPLALALAAAGRLDEARAALDEVLALLPVDGSALRVQLVARGAFVDQLRGAHDQARAVVQAQLAALDDPTPAARAELGLVLVYDAMWRADHAGMRGHAVAVAEAAEAAGTGSVAAVALSLRALADYAVGALADSRSHADAASSLVDALTDTDAAAHIDALLMLGVVEYNLERFAAALHHADRGLALARVTGQELLVAPLMVARAETLAFLGRLPEAAAQAEEAYEVAVLVASHSGRSMADAVGCWVATAGGDPEAGIVLGERALGGRDAVAGGMTASYAALYLAEALLAAGRPREARERLLAEVGTDLVGIEAPSRSRAGELLVGAALATGDLDEARRWLARAEDALQDSDLGIRRAEVARARAEVALGSADPDRAVHAADAAVAAAEPTGAAVELARSRRLRGRVLRAAGRTPAAITDLRQAETGFSGAGAARVAVLVRAELERLGADPPPREHSGAALLSGREREVADLVADGLTNRQVAARLFVSEKTVESHLAQIFGKLGIRSRAAVARALDT